jgi:hypothetical protein
VKTSINSQSNERTNATGESVTAELEGTKDELVKYLIKKKFKRPKEYFLRDLTELIHNDGKKCWEKALELAKEAMFDSGRFSDRQRFLLLYSYDRWLKTLQICSPESRSKSVQKKLIKQVFEKVNTKGEVEKSELKTASYAEEGDKNFDAFELSEDEKILGGTDEDS